MRCLTPQYPAQGYGAGEACAQGRHQKTWDEHTTKRQLIILAVWPGSMSWTNRKLSLMSMNQEILRSQAAALWAGHSGVMCKMKQQKIGEKEREANWAETTWPLRAIMTPFPIFQSLLSAPMRLSYTLFHRHGILSRGWALQWLEHGSWVITWVWVLTPTDHLHTMGHISKPASLQ